MPEKSNHTVELLKYPVLVLSILVALVALKFILGFEFGFVTEVSTQGIKFAEQSQATLEALAQLEVRVSESEVRIGAVEENLQAPAAEVKRVESKVDMAAQRVSDATAKIAHLRTATPHIKEAPLRGYIWIGNYDTAWDSPRLARLDNGQPIEMPPKQIQPETRYRVLDNLIVRDGLPPNDAEYYRARENLGVIPRGGIVSITKEPKGIDREFAVQYWAEVELVPQPHAAD
jgi:hypothetical protein